jgi:hypothetical protein
VFVILWAKPTLMGAVKSHPCLSRVDVQKNNSHCATATTVK